MGFQEGFWADEEKNIEQIYLAFPTFIVLLQSSQQVLMCYVMFLDDHGLPAVDGGRAG